MTKNSLWSHCLKIASLWAAPTIAVIAGLFIAAYSARSSDTVTLSISTLAVTAAGLSILILLTNLILTQKISLFINSALTAFNQINHLTGTAARVCIKDKPEEFIQLADEFNSIISQLEQSTESNQQVSYIIQSMEELLVVVSKTGSVLLTNTMFDKLLEKLEIPKYGELSDDGLFTENKIDYKTNFNIEADHPFAITGSDVDTHEAEYIIGDGSDQKINIKWRRATLLTDSGEFNGFIFAGTDTTSVKSMNEELRIRNHAIEAASNGVVIIDINNDMSIIYVNPAFEEITGYTYKEVLGKNWQLFNGEKTSATAIATMNESLRLKKSLTLDLINYRKDGRPFWNELSLSPVYDSSGEATHYLLIQNDISERIQGQQDLEKAIQKAELANKAKSEFLANMSHEIRTPMNAVLGMSALCLETSLDEQQKDYVEKIHQSGSLLLGIINDILDFSKIEVGKLTLDNITFSLSEVFEKLEVVTEQEIKRKNLHVNIDIDTIDSQILKGDPLRLGQILLNLTTNSIKFTEQGSIDISVKQLKRQGDDLLLEFVVEDTGIGMTQEQASKIFQSFSQADNSITRKYGGSGLGLTICQSFVHMMKGDIHVDSQPNVGTKITFTANFSIASENERLSLSKESHKKIQSDNIIKDAEILVVEDNQINQQVAKEILRKMGAIVTIANNGQEAVRLVQNQVFSIVLMDLQMPIMDGLTATRYIRSELAMTDLTIIAMTANAMTGDRELCLKAGMNDYITKPIDISLLKSTLVQWLDGEENVSDKKERQNDKKLDSTNNNSKPLPTEDGGDNNKLDSVIDKTGALKRLSGDISLLNTLLDMFYSEHLDDCEKIKVALDNNDYKEAKSIAHTLKGVAGSIGATSVYNHANELDSALKHNYNDKIGGLFSQLENAMGSLNAFLNNRH